MGRNFFEHPLVLVVLVLLIVVVFGAKRLPDAARSLGRSMRIFKSEVREMKDDDKPGTTSAAGTPSRSLEGKIVDGGDARDAAGSGDHLRETTDPTRDAQRHSA